MTITKSQWLTLVLLASCLLPTGGFAGGSDPDLAIDHDRIHYVRPYARALQQAREERRILVVRPFPVGGVVDGSRDGRWCPLADYMRAVTLSEETVVTLINRRFVFTYFSLVDWSDLSDAEAKQAVVRVAPEFGEKVRRTPPTFFLSPEGAVLGTLDTMAPASSFLHLAKSLLAAHPEYDRPTSAETWIAASAARDPRSRLRLARLQLELADLEAANTTLTTLTAATVDATIRAEALYLLGRQARIDGDGERAAEYLARVATLATAARTDLALDLRMEHAHLDVLRGDWERALQAWSAIEADAPSFARTGELLYAKGLSYYHLGKRREANYTWVRLIQEVPEGRHYQKARLAAMGPAYSPASPDLAVPGRTPQRYFSRSSHPTRLPGSELGYGTSSDGRAGTEATPERFLRRAYRDFGEMQRRMASAHAIDRGSERGIIRGSER